MTRWGLAGWHQFFRVLVAQTVERETTTLGDIERLDQQLGRIETAQPFAAAQIALAVGEEGVTGFGDEGLQPDGGESVLQCAARAYVHMYVAGSYQRNVRFVGKCFKSSQTGMIVGAEEQFCSDPAATFET